MEKTPLIPRKWGWVALGALMALQVYRVFAFPMRGDEVFPLMFGQIPLENFSEAWFEGYCPSPLHFLWSWVCGCSVWWGPRLLNLLIWWIGAGVWGSFFNKSEERRQWFFPWLMLGACSDLGLLAATDGQWYVWVWLMGGFWFSQWNQTVARQWKQAVGMGALLGFGGVITLLLPLVFGIVQIRKAGPFALQILSGTVVYSLFQHGGFSADWNDLFHFSSTFSAAEILEHFRSNSGFADPLGGIVGLGSLGLFFGMKDSKWKWLGLIGVFKVLMILAMALLHWSPLENRTVMVLEWGAPLVFAVWAARTHLSKKWLMGLLLVGGLSQVWSIQKARSLAQKEWDKECQMKRSHLKYDDSENKRALIGWARAHLQHNQEAIFLYEENSKRGEFLGGLAEAAEEKNWIASGEK